MTAASRLGKQIAEITATLDSIGASYALIGGLALASHNVVRATQDVDLLVPLEKADEIENQLSKLGYRCLHRSADAGNYVRTNERLDLLYASRPIALRANRDTLDVSEVRRYFQLFNREPLLSELLGQLD